MNRRVLATLLVIFALCAIIVAIVFAQLDNIVGYSVSMNVSVIFWATAFVLKE